MLGGEFIEKRGFDLVGLVGLVAKGIWFDVGKLFGAVLSTYLLGTENVTSVGR
jgi:hypothetical protein